MSFSHRDATQMQRNSQCSLSKVEGVKTYSDCELFSIALPLLFEMCGKMSALRVKSQHEGMATSIRQ